VIPIPTAIELFVLKSNFLIAISAFAFLIPPIAHKEMPTIEVGIPTRAPR